MLIECQLSNGGNDDALNRIFSFCHPIEERALCRATCFLRAKSAFQHCGATFLQQNDAITVLVINRKIENP